MEADKRTLPLSVDILIAERTRDGSKNPLQDLAFFTALLLGFTMLTRASNYLPITSATYHLDAEHISFNVALSPAPAPHPVKLRPAYWVSSRCLVFGSVKGKRIPSGGTSAELCLRHRHHTLSVCRCYSPCSRETFLSYPRALLVTFPCLTAMLQT